MDILSCQKFGSIIDLIENNLVNPDGYAKCTTGKNKSADCR
jgi:hypothetical protein